ncbi:MAG: AarF/UbiB family protein [Acidimicrobiales bacterium]
MLVSEAMQSEVPTVAPDDTVAEAARTLRKLGRSAVLVVSDDGQPAGILTERDIVHLVVDGADPAQTLVEARMSTDLVTVRPDAEVIKVQELMAKHSIRHVPVVDGGRLVGMITVDSALARAAAAVPKAERGGTGVMTRFRGPYAAGPPPKALVIDAPRLEKIRVGDLGRLIVAGWLFAILTARSVLGWLVRRRGRSLATAISEGLVDAFEALGPTFVKLGQLITSSPGVFPEPLANACKRCLDEVPPFPGEGARRMIEEDLGRSPSQLFRSFEDTPLASASIAQVHACVLPDGREAVIKMQRPAIHRKMNSDLRILYKLARGGERFELGRRLNLSSFVADMHMVTNQELNSALEAHRQTLFREGIGAFGDNRHITAPEVHWDYCGPRMICMERMYGVPVDSFEILRERSIDGELILRRGIKVGLEACLVHGPFHGDVHAGNIWVLDDGRASFLDFGLMGELSDEWKQVARDLFKTTMIDNNWARIVRNYKNVGVLPPDIGSDEEVGMRLQLVVGPLLDTSAGGVNLGEVFKQQLELAQSMGAKAPQELMLLAKQIFYFERYIKGLAPAYVMARDLFLIKNVWPEEAAAKARELGIEFPD